MINFLKLMIRKLFPQTCRQLGCNLKKYRIQKTGKHYYSKRVCKRCGKVSYQKFYRLNEKMIYNNKPVYYMTTEEIKNKINY
jgi:tRNA(Ile)-lysidine synthase TilS/MesJ